MGGIEFGYSKAFPSVIAKRITEYIVEPVDNARTGAVTALLQIDASLLT